MRTVIIFLLASVFNLALIFGTVYVTHFWGYSNWIWVITVLTLIGFNSGKDD